jgi:hypothetical protein
MVRVMDSDRTRWLGIVLIALTGLLHLVEAPEYLGEERYIGALFIASAVGSAIALYGIWRDQVWGWLLGIAVAGGAFVGYVLSRTVGLPRFREASWSQFLEPMGLLSLLVEGLFVVLALRVLTSTPEPERERRVVSSPR